MPFCAWLNAGAKTSAIKIWKKKRILFKVFRSKRTTSLLEPKLTVP